MPLMQGKSQRAFDANVSAERNAGKPAKQALAIAYAVRRKAAAKAMAKGGEVKCSKCHMAHGGPCMMAEGGDVLADHVQQARENLEVSEPTVAKMDADEALEMDTHPSMTRAMEEAKKKAPMKMAAGGLVDEIMSARHKSEPLEAGPEHETALVEETDFSNYHHVPDMEHDDPPATLDDKAEGQDLTEDDRDLVSQILRDRKNRRRG